ncbi:MAG: peptidoglycan DD-metalloendopeptidase family protein [Desulfococcaceae bacterium]
MLTQKIQKWGFALVASVSLSIVFTMAHAQEKRVGPPLLALEYGINCDPYEVRRDVVQPGENLSEILLDSGVPYSKIQTAVDRCEGVFDVRKIRAGRPYSLIGNPCVPEGIRYFVYERTPVNFVVFDLGETVKIFEGQKPIKVENKTFFGTIHSSLWNAFSEAEIDFQLAMRLSKIYAWTLDFFRFQPGDRFGFIVEERRANGQVVGYGRILAACIHKQDQPYYAFYFEEKPGEGGYYDEKGESLRKAFLKAPLEYSRISSGYSHKRLHPILNEYRPHLGIDYAAPTGTPVLSVGDGKVEKAGYNRSMGRYIQIRHNHRYMTQYLHLSGTADGIQMGAEVKQGQKIGYVGSTGLSTGPHLDFRFWEDGKAVNFLKQDIPSADPVDPDLRKRFYSLMASLRFDLDNDGTREFSAKIPTLGEGG